MKNTQIIAIKLTDAKFASIIIKNAEMKSNEKNQMPDMAFKLHGREE